VTELAQIKLAGLIIAGPSTFVKVTKILQNISYEEVLNVEHDYILNNLKDIRRHSIEKERVNTVY